MVCTGHDHGPPDPPRRDRYDVSSLNWAIGGGGTLEARIRAFSEFFKGARYIVDMHNRMKGGARSPRPPATRCRAAAAGQD